MRRLCQHTLIVVIAASMTGCSYLPDFPDLWPFNDEPEAVTSDAASSKTEAETAQAPIQPEPLPAPGTVVYIVSPADGDIVTNPMRVVFGLDRMGIAPVTSTHEATGHHHLLVDTELPQLDLPIPVDDNHRHFSGGQTETLLNLPVGEHSLQLLLGDHTHTPHQPPIISQPISIVVQ